MGFELHIRGEEKPYAQIPILRHRHEDLTKFSFLTAIDALGLSILELNLSLSGIRIDLPKFHLIVTRVLSDILFQQAQIRGLPNWPLREQACDFKLSCVDKSVHVIFERSWIDSTDMILTTRVCRKCGYTIPGRRHPQEECREVTVRDIMES